VRLFRLKLRKTRGKKTCSLLPISSISKDELEHEYNKRGLKREILGSFIGKAIGGFHLTFGKQADDILRETGRKCFVG